MYTNECVNDIVCTPTIIVRTPMIKECTAMNKVCAPMSVRMR